MLDGVGSLQINLAAIQNNWTAIQQQTQRGVETAAVVKANGYGLGVEPVVKALIAQGCRSFFVATVAEALEIRRFTTDQSALTVIVLSGITPSSFAVCAEQHLIPVLYTPELVAAWSAFNLDQAQQFPCVIKVDTGMHRLGLTQQQFSMLVQQRDVLLTASPLMLMSHLACADTPEHPLNALQLDRFEKNAAAMKRIVPTIKLCLANSSGVYLGKQYHFDMVRPGYALYGGNPQPAKSNPMSPVVTLSLPIAQLKQITGPASVGYGATYTIAEDETRNIAIVLGGYADGVLRHLSNQGCGVLGNQTVPMVGRVSMDSLMFDVSAVDHPEQYSSLTLIGESHSIDDVAQAAGTIGYEILTQLGARYHRQYLTNS